MDLQPAMNHELRATGGVRGYEIRCTKNLLQARDKRYNIAPVLADDYSMVQICTEH
jgi:hypothetical protein